MCAILGRHAHHGSIQREASVLFSNSSGALGFTGFHHQHQKEHFLPLPSDRVLGLYTGFQGHDHSTPEPEDPPDPQANQAGSGGEGGLNKTARSVTGIVGSSPPSGPSSTLVLQTPGEGEIQGSATGRVRLKSVCGPSDQERDVLVAGPFDHQQWPQPTDHSLGPSHRVGCFDARLGSQLQGSKHRGAMDQGRKNSPHKLPGVASLLSSPEDIRSRSSVKSNPPTYRQCNSSGISEQDGRNPLVTLVQLSSRHLEVVSREVHSNSCGTPSRKGKCKSRLGVSAFEGFKRLEVTQGNLPTPGGETGTILDRSLCLENEHTTSGVLQLEAGPNGTNSRCPLDPMEQAPSVPVSSIHLDQQMSGKDQQGGNRGSNGGTSLAKPGLVSKASGAVIPRANPSPRNTEHSVEHRGRLSSPSPAGPPALSRLAHIRKTFSAEGFSEGVIQMLTKSWRGSTETAYSSAWRTWNSWCAERSLHPLSAPVSEVLEFLLEQFLTGKQYRTLNTIRSAISMTHGGIKGVPVGQHQLVSRFMRGVFNSRPPIPRYTSTWDVDVVLKHLAALPGNQELSLPMLTHKLAMLLALTSAKRCSELASLDLRFCSIQSEGARFVIPGLTKTRRTGPPKEVFFAYFHQNVKLCPVNTLVAYRERTKTLRPATGESGRLFIAVRRPHLPVKPATIGHWLKRIMERSGINTKIFAAHSTRGASTSKAEAGGVSVPDILKAADWSSASTFTRFYHRPVQPAGSTFGRVVLSGRQ